MHLKPHHDPGISFNPMACRVSQICHPSHVFNVMHFHLYGINTMVHDVTYIAFVSSSCASSLNVTPLNVSHRSFAAAVQRMDSEILRNLATLLIPENILPSLAGIPDVDWVNFMAMVKGGGTLVPMGGGSELLSTKARLGGM